MHVLPREKQVAIAKLLVEGCSIRGIERVTGTHRDTVCRLLLRIGKHCEAVLDRQIQGVVCTSVQLDELWCYVHKK